MELIFTILKEGFSGSAKSIIQIAVIVIPLIIVMQIAKDFNIIDKITPILTQFQQFLGLKRSKFPTDNRNNIWLNLWCWIYNPEHRGRYFKQKRYLSCYSISLFMPCCI